MRYNIGPNAPQMELAGGYHQHVTSLMLNYSNRPAISQHDIRGGGVYRRHITNLLRSAAKSQFLWKIFKPFQKRSRNVNQTFPNRNQVKGSKLTAHRIYDRGRFRG